MMTQFRTKMYGIDQDCIPDDAAKAVRWFTENYHKEDNQYGLNNAKFQAMKKQWIANRVNLGNFNQGDSKGWYEYGQEWARMMIELYGPLGSPKFPQASLLLLI